MKLSLSWIFDHIDADWRKQDVAALVAKFNQVTAEIEDYHEVCFDYSRYFLGKVTSAHDSATSLHIAESGQDVQLAGRKGAKVGDIYLLAQDEKGVRFATRRDFGLDKDGLLPAFDITDGALAGEWRKGLEARDIILEVDNKSITHRPDMWGHRGFAREIAAFLELPFKDKSEFLEQKKISVYEKQAACSKNMPISLVNSVSDTCGRFAALYFDRVESRASNLFMAMRLVRTGVGPHSLLVDLTNYVMLDWSQPMHAYDGAKIKGDTLEVRFGRPGEKMVLLDGNHIELSDQDIVIADKKDVLCLGGVMGGLESGISPDTRSMVLEAAHFDAATIRRSALRHKIRTESSARFEKTLDPNQITEAIERFIALARSAGLSFSCAESIEVIGAPLAAQTIEIDHDFFEKRAGFELEKRDVVGPLERLGFGVSVSKDIYVITIPSFRGAKDVTIAEDIFEEVIRFYGFNNIKPVLPAFVSSGNVTTALHRERMLKRHLAMGLGMIEQKNYGFFDESFLKKLSFDPGIKAASLQNPVSENYVRLLTTLVPSLCKNIEDNVARADELNFFEVGKTWVKEESEILEHKHLAGIFFSKRGGVDFYACKARLESLMHLLGLRVSWHKKEDGLAAWMHPYQTAELQASGRVLGAAGMMSKDFLSKLDVLRESQAFVFELDARGLLAGPEHEIVMKPLAKYQDVEFDLSFFVPLTVHVATIEAALKEVDPLVESVRLIDFFEKDEWVDKRSLAFRCRVVPLDKTLEKDEIEAIRHKALVKIELLGGVLRS